MASTVYFINPRHNPPKYVPSQAQALLVGKTNHFIFKALISLVFENK
jgi:hypothetical protein